MMLAGRGKPRPSNMSLMQQLDCIATLNSDISSIHGAVWYNKLQNRYLKALSVVFVGTLFWTTIVVVIVSAVSFIHNDSVGSTVVRATTHMPQLPQVTLCHPYYFDKRAIASLGVPDEEIKDFSSILALIFNPFNMITSDREALKKGLSQFEIRKDEIFAKYGFKDVFEMAVNISIKCEDFIPMHFVHNKVSHRTCKSIVDPSPIFSATGVCFRSNHSLASYLPGIGSALTFIVYVESEKYAGLSREIYGDSLFIRQSPQFSFSNVIYNYGLSQTLKTFPLQAVTRVGLELLKTDKSATKHHLLLPEDKQCVDEIPQFSTAFKNLPYSYDLCTELFIDFIFRNCTLTPYSSLPRVSDRPLCTPQLIFSSAVDGNGSEDFPYKECPEDCFSNRTNIVHMYTADYNMQEISEAALEEESDPRTFKGIALLQMYYATHEVTKTVFVKDGISTLLSNIGGLLGIAMGASFVSLGEMVILSIIALNAFIKWSTKSLISSK